MAAAQAAARDNSCNHNPEQRNWKYWGSYVGDYKGADAANKHNLDPKTYGKNAAGGVISLQGDKNAYEVGLYPHPDGQGGFMPVYDFYGEQGRKIQQALGKNLEKFKSSYAEHAIRNQAKAQGYSVQKKVTSEGHVQLTLEPR
jgi:hypothetical protein